MSWKISGGRSTDKQMEALRKAGYTVKVRSPYHWQIFKKDTIMINVWPTAKKIMRQYGDGADLYTDVVKAADDLLQGKRELPPLPPIPQWQQEAMDRHAKDMEWLHQMIDEQMKLHAGN